MEAFYGINVVFINCYSSNFKSNTAGLGRVMWIIEMEQISVYDSVLSNNSAELAGGALMLSSNFITHISNSQFIGNSVSRLLWWCCLYGRKQCKF